MQCREGAIHTDDCDRTGDEGGPCVRNTRDNKVERNCCLRETLERGGQDLCCTKETGERKRGQESVLWEVTLGTRQAVEGLVNDGTLE